MKKNDFVQIKGMDIKELMLKAKDLKIEIGNLVMDKNMKQMKDLKTINKKRKDLAQVLTVARQKELLGKLEAKVSKVSELEKKEEVKERLVVEKKGKTKASK